MTPTSRFDNVWLIGVGMMGASLVIKLREKHMVSKIFGIDKSIVALEYALQKNIIDGGACSITEAVQLPALSHSDLNAPSPDLVIIATPVQAIEKIFKQLRGMVNADTLIIDIGSTKSNIIQWAKNSLSHKEFSNYVPCHPLCGRELNGPEAANPDIFFRKKCLVLSHPELLPNPHSKIQAMWTKVGCVVEEIEADYHDEVLAATSHLPHYLSFIIVDLLTDNADLQDALNYTGGGFKDFSRMASSNPTMWADIGIDNSKNLVKWMKYYMKTIENYIDLLEQQDITALHHRLTTAKKSRDVNILD